MVSKVGLEERKNDIVDVSKLVQEGLKSQQV